MNAKQHLAALAATTLAAVRDTVMEGTTMDTDGRRLDDLIAIEWLENNLPRFDTPEWWQRVHDDYATCDWSEPDLARTFTISDVSTTFAYAWDGSARHRITAYADEFMERSDLRPSVHVGEIYLFSLFDATISDDAGRDRALNLHRKVRMDFLAYMLTRSPTLT